MADGDTQQQPSTGLLGVLQNVPILGGLLSGGGQGAGYNAALYGGQLNDPATQQAMRTRQLGAMAAAFAEGATPTPYKGGLLQFARTLGNVGYASTIANDSTMDARLKAAQATLSLAQAGNQEAIMKLNQGIMAGLQNRPGPEPDTDSSGKPKGGPTSQQVAGAANAFDTGDPFLNLVALHESKYQPFVGTGGTDLSKTPLDNTGFPTWDGIKTTNPVTGKPDVSTAAGLFQITGSNWHKYAPGLIASGAMKPDFSVPSQIAVAKAMMAANGKSDWLPYNKNLAAADARGDTVPVPAAGGPPGTAPPLPGAPPAPGSAAAAAAAPSGGLLDLPQVPNAAAQLAAPAATPRPSPAPAPAPTGLLTTPPPQGGSPDVASPLVRAAAAQAAGANIPGARPGAPSVGAPGPGPGGPLLAGPGATGGNLVPGGGANLPIPPVTAGPPAAAATGGLLGPPPPAPAGGAPGAQTPPGATPVAAAPQAAPAPPSAPAAPIAPAQLTPAGVPPGMKISNAQIKWAQDMSLMMTMAGHQVPPDIAGMAQLPVDLAKQDQDARMKAFYELQTAGLKPIDMRENTLHVNQQTGDYTGNMVVTMADNRQHRVLVTGNIHGGQSQMQDMGPAALSPQETAQGKAVGTATGTYGTAIPPPGAGAAGGGAPGATGAPTPRPQGTLVAPNMRSSVPDYQEPQYTAGQLKDNMPKWADINDQMAASVGQAQQAEQRLMTIAHAYQMIQTGAFTTDKASWNAALQSIWGPNAPLQFSGSDPAQVEKALHELYKSTLQMLSTVNKRFTGKEFQVTAESSESPDIRPEANLQMLGEDIGVLRQQRALATDWNNARIGDQMNGIAPKQDPEIFETKWRDENQLGPIVEGVKKEIGTGNLAPPPAAGQHPPGGYTYDPRSRRIVPNVVPQ